MKTIISNLNVILFNMPASNYFEPLVEKYFPKYSLIHNKAVVTQVVKELNTITITLRPTMKWGTFKPGQYIELGVKINGIIFRRAFSISSSEEQYAMFKTFSLTIQQTGGRFTGYMYGKIKNGDTVFLSGPKGEFTNPVIKEPLLYIAGGAGITPFRSMLHECVKNNYSCTLLYYARSGQHLFRNELAKLSVHDNIKVNLIETDIEGRISIVQLKQYCPDFYTKKIFICGRGVMVEDCRQLLLNAGAPAKNIVTEFFTLPKPELNNNKGTVLLKDAAVFTHGNETVLEGLEAHGFAPRYGCRMGICKQCQCKKKMGVVFNKLSGNYSDAAEGFIQPCISIPIGEVEIELD